MLELPTKKKNISFVTTWKGRATETLIKETMSERPTQFFVSLLIRLVFTRVGVQEQIYIKAF